MSNNNNWKYYLLNYHICHIVHVLSNNLADLKY